MRNLPEYKVSATGTSYNQDTDDKVIAVLEQARADNARIRLYYGDTDTGRDWEEEYDVEGRVDRSCGDVKIPILLRRSDSYGGGAILTNCIVRIEYTTAKERQRHGTLYQHPKYHRECDHA